MIRAHTRRTVSRPPGVVSGPLLSATAVGMLLTTVLLAGAERPLAAQSVDDPVRLAGVPAVRPDAEAQWDEAITVEAGGATPDQFLQALRMSFRETLAGADPAPGVDDGAPVTVTCHVDTFYDNPLIIYSLRVQTEEARRDGEPVITWIDSWVGSFTVQQLHLMFGLGEQCAESFLEDWRSVN